PKDVNKVCHAILRDFEAVAIAYFEEFSTLPALYDILKDNGEEGSLHCSFDGSRCMRAVVLGRILNEPDVDEVVKRNDEFLAKRNDRDRGRFRKLVEELLGKKN